MNPTLKPEETHHPDKIEILSIGQLFSPRKTLIQELHRSPVVFIESFRKETGNSYRGPLMRSGSASSAKYGFLSSQPSNFLTLLINRLAASAPVLTPSTVERSHDQISTQHSAFRQREMLKNLPSLNGLSPQLGLPHLILKPSCRRKRLFLLKHSQKFIGLPRPSFVRRAACQKILP